MKIIKYFIQSIVIYFFFLLIKIIGLKLGRKVFSVVFKKIGPLIKTNNISNKNLKEILNIGIDERKKIISSMWSNYGMVFAEYIYLYKFRKDNFKDKYIRIKGQKNLDEIIRNNKQVIFVSGHFGNFELMSMELDRQNIKLATIYRPLNNIFLNPFMEYLREKYICKNQIQKGFRGIRSIINYMQSNYSIALMIDQRVSEGKRIPFFGKEALTTTLPAQLALRYECDIVPIYISRHKHQYFDLEIYPPISIVGKEENEKNKNQITSDLNVILENMILRDPGQWIWTHNRWK